jgi:deoxyribose-phosphate aldolase
MPYALKWCAEKLAGSHVKASTTIGFPHGGHSTRIKVAEAEQALDDGGEELDMVVNISRVLSGEWDAVREDIRAVIDVTHARGQKVKVIFENAYLNDEQKIRLCEICSELNADWVKTSTGYAPGGATNEDLMLMRKHTPGNCSRLLGMEPQNLVTKCLRIPYSVVSDREAMKRSRIKGAFFSRQGPR